MKLSLFSQRVELVRARDGSSTSTSEVLSFAELSFFARKPAPIKRGKISTPATTPPTNGDKSKRENIGPESLSQNQL